MFLWFVYTPFSTSKWFDVFLEALSVKLNELSDVVLVGNFNINHYVTRNWRIRGSRSSPPCSSNNSLFLFNPKITSSYDKCKEYNFRKADFAVQQLQELLYDTLENLFKASGTYKNPWRHHFLQWYTSDIIQNILDEIQILNAIKEL